MVTIALLMDARDRVLKIAEGEIGQMGSPKARGLNSTEVRALVPLSTRGTAQAGDYIAIDATVKFKCVLF